MPVVDRREFGGRFTVRENAQRLANYRYLEIQLMEMLGGWCHTTPQLAMKTTFGYHVYDHAQAADLLGERLEQLRSGRESQEPATDEFDKLFSDAAEPYDVLFFPDGTLRRDELQLSDIEHAGASVIGDQLATAKALCERGSFLAERQPAGSADA